MAPHEDDRRASQATGVPDATAEVPDGAAAPEGAEPFAAVAETHTAAVFFVGDRVYKLKKPVSFGFVDFTGRAARRAACLREVELNRRLAPDVYLGVFDVIDPGGEPRDHLVTMRRLPADRRLASLVLGGAPVEEDLGHLARVLAAFHARAERSEEIDVAAGQAATLARWTDNAAEMAPLMGTIFDHAVGTRVMDRARRYLTGRGALLTARVAAGRACDGHGDLLADDIFCLPDGPRVLDCLEFADRLRHGDALGDVAFLAMDLERLGRPDLAVAFLDRYREYSGDAWPASLAHHHIAYRAQVRALVAGLRVEQGDATSGPAARQLLALADRHLEAGRVRQVVVGGPPGSGKSTLAAGIGAVLGAAVLRSDEVRKELAGLDPATPAGAPFGRELYRAEMASATYTELIRQARICLANGVSVVLDATFSTSRWRRAARALATETVADLDEVRCVAPPAIAEARVAERLTAGSDVSDATAAVARRMAGAEEPWPEALVVETTAPVATVRRRALQALVRPDGGGG